MKVSCACAGCAARSMAAAMAAAIQVRRSARALVARFMSMAVLLRRTVGLRSRRAREEAGRPACAPTTRPSWMKTISSARRRAWPRLCVVMTILVPSASKAAMMRSISRVAPGSRLAVGSSRKRISGSQRPGAREREALLLAAGEHARRAVGDGVEADARERSPGAPLALRRRARRAPRARRRRWRARERRSITGRWNTIACRRAAALPRRPARGGRDEPVQHAQQHALARAVGAQDDGARPGSRIERKPIEDRAPPSTTVEVAGRRAPGRRAQPWRRALLRTA